MIVTVATTLILIMQEDVNSVIQQKIGFSAEPITTNVSVTLLTDSLRVLVLMVLMKENADVTVYKALPPTMIHQILVVFVILLHSSN